MGQAKIGLKYLMFRAGPMTMAASLPTGFLKTRKDLETTDIQFHVPPLSAENPGKGADKFSA
jgi:choline dehydrogenase